MSPSESPDPEGHRASDSMSVNAPIFRSRVMPGHASSVSTKLVLCLIAMLHLTALIILVATESDPVGKAAFLLVWAMLNCFWLTLVRRPAVAALLSLEFVIVLTLLSRFKYDKLWLTLDFVYLMILDQYTSAFLLAAFPSMLRWLLLVVSCT